LNPRKPPAAGKNRPVPTSLQVDDRELPFPQLLRKLILAPVFGVSYVLYLPLVGFVVLLNVLLHPFTHQGDNPAEV
jgi:hypothetical protein